MKRLYYLGILTVIILSGCTDKPYVGVGTTNKKTYLENKKEPTICPINEQKDLSKTK